MKTVSIMWRLDDNRKVVLTKPATDVWLLRVFKGDLPRSAEQFHDGHKVARELARLDMEAAKIEDVGMYSYQLTRARLREVMSVECDV